MGRRRAVCVETELLNFKLASVKIFIYINYEDRSIVLIVNFINKFEAHMKKFKNLALSMAGGAGAGGVVNSIVGGIGIAGAATFGVGTAGFVGAGAVIAGAVYLSYKGIKTLVK